MKSKSTLSFGLILTVTALATAAVAQSPQVLPGCEAIPEVRKSLDEKLDNKDLRRMKFRDRVAHEQAVYEELMAEYPREVQSYNRLIVAAREDPVWYSALQERFRKAAAQHANDPLALYVAGLALLETDTPESLRLLETAKAKAPEFPWPPLLLAGIYSSGRRADKPKASENLAAFFTLCPDSTDEWAQGFLADSQDLVLQKKVAAALRARLATESDPTRLKNYAALWSLEFRTYPPQKHDVLRKQIAEDLKRIESLNPRADSAWQAFLIDGYRQAGASSEAIAAMEDRLLREYAHSAEAYYILSERWHKVNKKPEDPRDAAAWAKYHELYKQALKGWMRDFPEDVAHDAWFNAIFDEDSLTERDGIAVMDEYLRHSTEYDPPGSRAKFRAADFLLKHKWQPSRALDLLKQAKTESDRERALHGPNDNLSAEDRNQFDEMDLLWDVRLYGQMLRAAQLIGRVEEVRDIKHFVEGPPPAQEKLQSDYWWNRARLALLEGRKQDALAYYQLSLHTRLETPQYSRGRFQDDLTDEAQTLWKERGGTAAAWAVWSKPLTSTGAELAQGRWEKETKALPAFELVDLSGKTWRLRDLEGKTVLINLWATWCVPCKEELPKVQKLYDEVKGRSDVQLLTFNVDEDLGMVAPYLRDNDYTFPVLPAYSLVNNLQVGVGYDGIPQNWVVDAKGKWLWAQIGYGAEENWAQEVIQKLESAKTGN